MAEYKGMTPETMYVFDSVFQRRAESGIFDPDNPLPAFSAPGELEVMHVIQRSISYQRKKPTALNQAMEIYSQVRETAEIQGLRGEKI